MVSPVPPQKQTSRWTQPLAAYVHIPFCVHRCHYCDFAVVTGKEADADRYLDALAMEIRRLDPSQRPKLQTLFVGGGTPTQLGAEQLERLLGTLRELLPWRGDAEISIEANPDGLTANKIDCLRTAGVTRISLGVQSFQAGLLRTLERQHTPDEAILVIESLMPRFPSVSVDLIFGVPGQTLESWRSDLEQVTRLGIPHVSCYGLTYEKGTELWKKRERGRILPVAEELEADCYGLAMDYLSEKGYEQYELSNFARPGHRCRHNETYWANDPHFGFGLGAAGFVDGVRATNTRSFESYISTCLGGGDPTQAREQLAEADHARETAMLNLRRRSGIERLAFRARTGFEIDQLAAAAIARHCARGWLVDSGTHLALTRAGKFMADSVQADFLVE